MLQVRHYPGMEIRKQSLQDTPIRLHMMFLSWQDRAYEPSQTYKEGKYILERNLLIDVQ